MAGYTLAEALFVCVLVAIIGAMAVPISLAGVDRSRGWAGARYVAARLVRARALAVSRGAAVALHFEGDDSQTALSSFADGNRNGVSSREIAAGLDPRLDGPVRLSALFQGVVTDFAADAPRLFSFSPDGTSTTGTVYLASRDGTRFAVRVLGTTARVRIERYVATRNVWVEAF
jgi:Tfp pilus assembly protein FimT